MAFYFQQGRGRGSGRSLWRPTSAPNHDFTQGNSGSNYLFTDPAVLKAGNNISSEPALFDGSYGGENSSVWGQLSSLPVDLRDVWGQGGSAQHNQGWLNSTHATSSGVMSDSAAAIFSQSSTGGFSAGSASLNTDRPWNVNPSANPPSAIPMQSQSSGATATLQTNNNNELAEIKNELAVLKDLYQVQIRQQQQQQLLAGQRQQIPGVLAPNLSRQSAAVNSAGPAYFNRGARGHPVNRPTDNQFSRQIAPTYYFDGSQDVDSFLEQFSNRADIFGWSEYERVSALKLNLKGKALEFLRSLGPVVHTLDFVLLSQQLKRRFSTAPTAGAAQLMLQQIKQLDNEGFKEFADRVRYLASIAYSGSQDDRLAINHFLSGLQDKDLVSAVINKGEDSLFEDLDYLLYTLKQISDKQQYIGRRQKSVRFAEQADAARVDGKKEEAFQVARFEQVIEPLRVKIDQMHQGFQKRDASPRRDAPQKSSSTEDDNDVATIITLLQKLLSNQGVKQKEGCFTCGSPDHFAANCPEKAKRSNSPQRSDKKWACHYCGSLEHFIANCPLKPQSGSHQSGGASPKGNSNFGYDNGSLQKSGSPN